MSYDNPTATDDFDGTVTVDCSPESGGIFRLGSTTVVCTATDSAGNTTTKSFNVTVTYDFIGFFQPIENDVAIFNVMKAGRAVPVRFKLGGDMGLTVFAAGYPRSVVIPCNSSALLDGIEETFVAGGSSLSYDAAAAQYNYVWKTESSWANTCRQFVVQFKDGSVRRANFKLTK